MTSSLFAASVKKSYACSGLILSLSLLACGVALVVIGIRWNIFTSNNEVLYEVVDGTRQVVGVKKTVALLWASFLVWPTCIVGVGLACVRKKSMIILLITTAAIACVGSFISSVTSNNVYQEIQQFAGHDADDRCEGNSFNDVNYCECEVKTGAHLQNQTRIWRLQVDECDDLEKIPKRMFFFFILSVIATCLSAALFLMAIFACCSPSEQELLLQQQQTLHYNSIKPPDEGVSYSGIYPRIKQDTDQLQQRNVGFENPVFSHCNDGEGKTVFWYPYSGATDAANEAGKEQQSKRGDWHSGRVSCSRFSKTESVLF